MKTAPICKKLAATKDLMLFPCSLPTVKKSFFAATETMAAQEILIFLLRIGWNNEVYYCFKWSIDRAQCQPNTFCFRNF